MTNIGALYIMNFVNRGDTVLMIINILKIKHASGEKANFHISEEFADTEVNGSSLTFVGPVEAQGEIVNSNGFFKVQGKTRGKLSAECVSCLENFELQIEGTLDEVYARQEDLSSDLDPEVNGFEGDLIDIGPEVLKSLLIELPMRLVCSPECRGLCHSCGSNLNVQQCNCQVEVLDPRLAVLKKLK